MNEDYAALLVEFENAPPAPSNRRVLAGPESEMAFELYGTDGAVGWSLERMNALRLYLASDEPHTGWTTVLGGERFPHHGAFAPGNALGLGFEDLVAIEDYEFLQAVAEGRHEPGFEDALRYVEVQEALVRLVVRAWEEVTRTAEAAA